jgi:hypothetical protein
MLWFAAECLLSTSPNPQKRSSDGLFFFEGPFLKIMSKHGHGCLRVSHVPDEKYRKFSKVRYQSQSVKHGWRIVYLQGVG